MYRLSLSRPLLLSSVWPVRGSSAHCRAGCEPRDCLDLDSDASSRRKTFHPNCRSRRALLHVAKFGRINRVKRGKVPLHIHEKRLNVDEVIECESVPRKHSPHVINALLRLRVHVVICAPLSIAATDVSSRHAVCYGVTGPTPDKNSRSPTLLAYGYDPTGFGSVEFFK